MIDQTVWRLLAITALVHLVFAVWPIIDIAASSYFVLPDGSFWLSNNPFAENIRMPLWLASVAVAIVSVVMLGVSLYLGKTTQTSSRLWAFIATTYLLGPGFLVNGILKQNWGRARPVNIVEFGGDRMFTPPFEIADQCAQNCSFVSGEAASAMVMIVVLSVCFHGAIRWHWRPAVFVGLATVFVIASGMRIGSGRHFLSDVVFAGLFMLIIARMCYLAFGVQVPQSNRLAAAVLADLSGAARPVWRFARTLISPPAVALAATLGDHEKQKDAA